MLVSVAGKLGVRPPHWLAMRGGHHALGPDLTLAPDGGGQEVRRRLVRGQDDDQEASKMVRRMVGEENREGRGKMVRAKEDVQEVNKIVRTIGVRRMVRGEKDGAG